VEIFASQGAPPVSTTPVANLPPVSTTPAENFATILPSVVDTGGKFATGVNDTSGKFPPVSKHNKLNFYGWRFFPIATDVNDTDTDGAPGAANISANFWYNLKRP
jgi:hypothetical protein